MRHLNDKAKIEKLVERICEREKELMKCKLRINTSYFVCNISLLQLLEQALAHGEYSLFSDSELKGNSIKAVYEQE